MALRFNLSKEATESFVQSLLVAIFSRLPRILRTKWLILEKNGIALVGDGSLSYGERSQRDDLRDLWYSVRALDKSGIRQHNIADADWVSQQLLSLRNSMHFQC